MIDRLATRFASLPTLRRRASCVAIALTLCVTAASLHAEPTPAERAAARALFDQGRELADKANYAEACPKFQESQRLHPGMGTLFNLANCNERLGKTATAWSQFLEVASQANAARLAAREAAARERAANLDKVLTRVLVSVASTVVVEGLDVRLDAIQILRPSWNTPLPVDPGLHQLQVSAPGYRAWTSTLDVPGDARTITIDVPELEPLSEAAPAQVQPPLPAPTASESAAPQRPILPPSEDAGPEPDSGTSRTTIGWVLCGAGAVTTGAAAYFAVDARADYDRVADQCPGNVCDRDGYDRRTGARSQMRVATTVAGVGLLGIGAGAWLLITAPSADASGQARGTSVAVGPGSVVVRGRF